MEDRRTQAVGLQVIAGKPKTRAKRKRARHLMPEVRRRIPALFAASGGAYDRVAEDLQIPASDVLAETLLDLIRKIGPDVQLRAGIRLVRVA